MSLWASNDQKIADRPVVSRRGMVLLGVQLGFGALLAWRMRQLQVVDAARYRLLAEENRINLELIATARAQLFDRRGEPLAINIKNYRVLMIREQAGDAQAMLDKLSTIIEIPDHQRERILREVRQKSAFVPVGVAEHLDWTDFAKINANAPALPGIVPEVGLTRLYPHGPETAHVVGYVGRVSQRDLDQIKKRDGETDPVLKLPEFQIGKTGIERALEDNLRGRAGSRRVEVNARGRVIRELDRSPGQAGKDLHLTLDLGIQKYCLERLGEESAAVVLMDPRNGDLLAMASTPTFDPNPFILGISHKDFNALRDNDHRPLHNKWASGAYPPASTFKMVVALAALTAGTISSASTHYCPGYLKLGRRKFHCWHRGGHGWLDLNRAIERSCDVYFYEVAKQVGIEKIGEMARQLGLGDELELPMAALGSGLIPNKEWKRRRYDEDWLIGDTLNAGIGQGYVLTTPLQLAVMTSRIASGRGVHPRLIHARGGVPESVPQPDELQIAREHLSRVRRGMFAVVNSRRGTAVNAKISDRNYRMAGKTGTAQVTSGIVDNAEVPWEMRDHALFVGFAPHNDPEFAISVVVEHGGSGSKAAAPIARDILMKARELRTPSDSAPAQGAAPGRRDRA